MEKEMNLEEVGKGITDIKAFLEAQKGVSTEHGNRIKSIEDALANVNKSFLDFRKRGFNMSSHQRSRRGLGSSEMNKAFGLAVKRLVKGELCEEVFSKALDDTSAGYLVTPDYHAELIRIVEERGIIRGLARKIPIGSGVNNWPRRTAGMTGYHVAPNVAGTESAPTVGQVQLVADTVNAICRIPKQTMEDSPEDLGAFVAEEIGYAFATVEDNDAINGDGTATYGNTNGLLSAALFLLTNKPTLVQMAAGKTSFADVTFDILMEVIDAVRSGELGGARWLMHRSVQTILRQVKDDQKRPIWEPATSAGMPALLLGYPVTVCDQMPARTASAASKKFLAFGNFNQWYFGDRHQMGIVADESRYREYNQVGFFGDERIAQGLSDGGAFAVLETSAA